ncbi:MAG: hypothetical protein FWF96_06510, partial [Kiritimatiellaeota bacterium]|nr:hypothetical protein [Kiritimatiellota bacterium]
TDNTCDLVHVAGDITLGGEIHPVFHNTAKRPRGEWVIATYDGIATGKISAEPGLKVANDTQNKILKLVSSEPGTLFLIR